MNKKNHLLLCSLFCTFMLLSACGQTAKEGTASLLQKSDYDWRTKGFTMAGEVVENPLFMVGYEKIAYEEVPDAINTTCQTTDSEAFCIMDTFYTSPETTYFFQRLQGETESAERLTLSTDRWGISDGFIQKMRIVDNNQYVFFVRNGEEDNGKWIAQHYYAVYTDHEGNLIKSVDIIETLKSNQIWESSGYSDSLVECDSRGNLYLRDMDRHEIFLLSSDGTLITNYIYPSEDGKETLQVFRTMDGEVLFANRMETDLKIVWMNPEDGTVKELITADMPIVSQWYGLFGDTLYYAADNKLIGWNIATGQQTMLFDMREYAIPDATPISNITVMESEEGIRILVAEKEERYLLTFSKEEPVKMDPITVANIYYDSPFLKGQTISFDRENPLYEIEYTNACEEEAATKVLMDMVNGQGPDILYLNREDMVNLQKKGALLDLNQILSKETLDVMLPAAIGLGTYGEELIGIPLSVNIRTMLTNRAYWQKDKWTVNDVINILSQHDELQGMFVDISGQDNYGYNLLYLIGMDTEHSSFIEGTEGGFDSSEFKNILKYIKEKSNNKVNPDLSASDEIKELLKEGNYLGMGYSMSCMDDFCRIYEVMGQDVLMVGYPTEEGSGNYVFDSGMLAVNPNARDKEGVKELLEFLLSLESQQKLDFSISVRLDIPESQVNYDKYLEKYCWELSDGRFRPLPEKSDGSSYLDEYVDFLKSAVPFPNQSDDLFNMVSEEANSYFYSDKSLNEVTKIIQSRVQLYLEENK
ncbi:MAG TPA: extracellular solute-binding protein [Lachnospiraceae bacterium]|nr:extracellular solute-binding protein [Lachnospiraceae bacterium]